MADHLWGPNGEKIPLKQNNEPHYASIERAENWNLVYNSLPDPDPILRKMGKGISALRELFIDDQLETVWVARLAGIKKKSWKIIPGDESKDAEAAKDYCSEMIDSWSIRNKIENIMEAVAFGFSPQEILWCKDGTRWGVSDLVGKPPEWFEFGPNNELLFRTSSFHSEQVPDNRFIIAQNRATYKNPYGVKLLSKVFWPVTFKRNGGKWWTIFVEKYATPFLYGKYGPNASTKDKDDLMNALYNIAAAAVAIGPEDTKIDIMSDNNKQAASSVYESYESFFNASISKVILGQTLTTEMGKTGSFSAAKVHLEVKEDLAADDAELVEDVFNRLFKMSTAFNWGENVRPPKFKFDEPVNIKNDQAERDKTLSECGVAWTEDHWIDDYGIPANHFTIKDDTPPVEFSSKRSKKKLFGLFSRETTDEYTDRKLDEGQKVYDQMVNRFLDEIENSDSFDAARENLLKTFSGKSMQKDRQNLAKHIDNIRYVGSQTGADDAKE